MEYEVYSEEYKGYTIRIKRDPFAPEPDWSFMGRFMFLGGRDYVDMIDDNIHRDFEVPWGYYREFRNNEAYNGNIWPHELKSIEKELRQKRYEFREVWRNGYDGSWSWGPPNVIVSDEHRTRYPETGWVEGIIYVTPEQIREEYGHKIATKQDRERVQLVLESELEVWSHWASGEVYGWIVEGDDLDESCWGYYEDYYDYGKGEPLYPIICAREVIDSHIAHREREDAETLDEYVLSIA